MPRTIDQVNHLNTGLMILSCLVAFIAPFELFVFSYAVLGPLHYFTEISWLHDRSYFTKPRLARVMWLSLVMVGMCLLMYGFVAETRGGTIGTISPKWEIAMVYLIFVAALSASVIRNRVIAVLLVLATLLSLPFASESQPYYIAAYFLITVIHVFIFTGAFVLYGALKSRSGSGFVSLAVFVACATIAFLYVPGSAYVVSAYVRDSYTSFQTLNAQILRLFDLSAARSAEEIYESSAGLSVMRFIAFAYTYHYLNWFSKTSIIKWHEVSRRRFALIVGSWALSLAIYAYDYKVGMVVLYVLSMLHVLLEFPLDHQTFAGIGRELAALARSRTLTDPARLRR